MTATAHLKQTELGLIPRDWEIRPLRELVANFDFKRVPIKDSERKNGKYPYYGASGIIDYIDDYAFDGEYVLLAEDGENLRSRILPVAFLAKGKFWANNHAHVLKGNERAQTQFLMYALQLASIDTYLTGTTLPKLSQQNMNLIPVALPSMEEQQAITKILSSLNDKIEVSRQMNATIEAIGRAIFKQWFIDLEFPGEDGKPYRSSGGEMVYDEELNRKIPKGWTVSTLGNEIEVGGGSTPDTSEPSLWEGGNLHWATPKDLSLLISPVLMDTERKITHKGLISIGSRIYPRGSLLMSSRAPIGYLAVSEVETAINQGMIAMVCAKSLSSLFMLNWCRFNMERIENMSNGTTFKEITKSSFRSIPVVVPPDSVVALFDKVVKPLHSRVISNMRQSEAVAGIKDSLLPKLMLGKIRVPLGAG